MIGMRRHAFLISAAAALAAAAGLAQAAATIAEHDEADRCRQFLTDLAPDAPAGA